MFSEAVKARERAEILIRENALELLKEFINNRQVDELSGNVIQMAQNNGIVV
jgi:hypothetical protein